MDFKKIIEDLKSLRNKSCFVSDCRDNSFIVGKVIVQQFWKVSILEHDYKEVPSDLKSPDIYSVLTNAQFGLNYDDSIPHDSQYTYQIYCFNTPKVFQIEELYKAKNKFDLIELYLRDEIFELPKAKKLATEWVKMIDKISKIVN